MLKRYPQCPAEKKNRIFQQHLLRLGHLGDEVVDTIDCKVEGCEARSQKTAPPPMIVLGTEYGL